MSTLAYEDYKHDKAQVTHVETVASVNNSDDADEEKRVDNAEEAWRVTGNIDHGYDPAHVKKVVRRIDWRLIPLLSAMYFVSLVDRTNLSSARQANKVQMDRDLGLSGSNNRYSIITLMFFIPYIIFEIPSQLGLRYFGARKWLGTSVFLWGLVMLCMGFAKTWYQLAIMRALLGFFESALFPGASFLISCWYPRQSMAIRMVIFYKVAATVGSLSSLLGYAFSLMHTLQGLHGWQWMFIMYGMITMLVGIAGFFLVTDFPDKATFLNDEDRKMVKTRIERDRSDAVFDPITKDKLFRYIGDWIPWVMAFGFMSTTLATYGLAYFLPMILKQLGFGDIEQMVLGTPAHVYGLIPAFLSAWIADKYKNMRAAVIIANQIILIAGTAMYSQLGASQKVARYAGIFLAVGSSNANVPLVVAWAQTSIRRQSKRGYVSGLVVLAGGIGGILASVTFINKEATKGYPTGVFFCIACNALSLVLFGLLYVYFKYQNRRADRGEVVLEDDVNFRYQG